MYSCYRYALSQEGLTSYRAEVGDLVEFFGYGAFRDASAAFGMTETLELLRRQVDGVDFGEIERIAGYRSIDGATSCGVRSDSLNEARLRRLVIGLS